MFSRQCPFCENVNPPNSKFCNACGIQLHAALCPLCGAANVVTATNCVHCAEPLESAQAEPGKVVPPAANTLATQRPARRNPAVAAVVEPALSVGFSVHFDPDHTAKVDRYDLDAVRLSAPADVAAGPDLPVLTNFVPSSPIAELNGWPTQGSETLAYSGLSTQVHQNKPPGASVLSRPRRDAALIGTVVFALLAGLAYVLYREHSRTNMMSLVYANGQLRPSDRSSDANAAPRRAAGSVVDTNSAPLPDAKDSTAAAVSEPLAAAPPASPQAPAEKAGATIDPPAPNRPQVASREAAAAVDAALARPKNPNASSARQAPRFDCTEATAALGLCAAPSPTSARQ